MPTTELKKLIKGDSLFDNDNGRKGKKKSLVRIKISKVVEGE